MLHEHGLEAILIGNAAAALPDPRVTPLFIEYRFRATRSNIVKLKAIARVFDAVLFRSSYPTDRVWRIMRDDDGLDIRFIESRPMDSVRTTQRQTRKQQLAALK